MTMEKFKVRENEEEDYDVLIPRTKRSINDQRLCYSEREWDSCEYNSENERVKILKFSDLRNEIRGEKIIIHWQIRTTLRE
jgi:hypothetical protein